MVYLYPDIQGVASYANFARQFHWPFLNYVRGVWATKRDP